MTHARERSVERYGAPLYYKDEKQLGELIEAGLSELIATQPQDGRQVHRVHWAKKGCMVTLVWCPKSKRVVTVLPRGTKR